MALEATFTPGGASGRKPLGLLDQPARRRCPKFRPAALMVHCAFGSMHPTFSGTLLVQGTSGIGQASRLSLQGAKRGVGRT